MPIKTCAFWDCLRPVPQYKELCQQHFTEREKGQIDRCLGCGRSKHIQYEICLDCYGNQTQPQGRRTPDEPNFESGSDDPPWASTGWDEAGGGVEERRSRYEVEQSPAWSRGDAAAETFYVYLLKLRDGTFYPGQTRDLQARLMEHRDGGVKMTAGSQPRLVWFNQLSSRKEAALAEVELKKLVDENPRKVRQIVVNFRNLLNEVDTEA